MTQPEQHNTPFSVPSAFRDLSTLADVDVEMEVITWAGRVNAGQARLLAAIAEFDSRGIWHADGWLSAAHWLSVTLAMTMTTAHEHVRIARKLRGLPRIAAAMAEGKLSYSQVRALTRIADAANELAWLHVAKNCSASQLEKLARGVTRAQARERGEGPKPKLSWSYDNETGDLVMSLRCPAEIGAPIIAAVEAAMEDVRSDRTGKPEDSSAEDSAAKDPAAEDSPQPRVSRLDGMVRLTAQYLSRRGKSAQVRDRSRLRVFVDPLSGWARLPDGELLPPGVTRLITNDELIPHLPRRTPNLGRLQREASAYQRQILEAIDGACCSFPGCDRRRNLHAHHIQWWSRGGPTDLDNLVLLCSRHHTLVHEAVYRLRLLPDRTLEVFSSKTGKTITRTPLPTVELDPVLGLDYAISPLAAAQNRYDGSDTIDFDYSISVVDAL